MCRYPWVCRPQSCEPWCLEEKLAVRLWGWTEKELKPFLA